MADFSGYIAADELYDGPFCVLSIVDNHTFRRITYEVLDHDPTHADMERFFHAFQVALQKRRLTLEGITTEGSALYPEPVSKVFGDVPHQVCEFHVVKELTVVSVNMRTFDFWSALGAGVSSSLLAGRSQGSAGPPAD